MITLTQEGDDIYVTTITKAQDRITAPPEGERRVQTNAQSRSNRQAVLVRDIAFWKREKILVLDRDRGLLGFVCIHDLSTNGIFVLGLRKNGDDGLNAGLRNALNLHDEDIVEVDLERVHSQRSTLFFERCLRDARSD